MIFLFVVSDIVRSYQISPIWVPKMNKALGIANGLDDIHRKEALMHMLVWN